MGLFGGKGLKIDPDLFAELAAVASERGYSSADEMAEHILREALRTNTSTEASAEDRKLAEEQLRGLGYLK